MELSPDLERQVTRTVSYVSGRIRTLRLARGLTVQELADRCGIERSNLSRIETGRKNNMTLRTLCIIGSQLRIHVRELLPDPETAGCPETPCKSQNKD